MARREVTAERKSALLADLRSACDRGELVPGDRLPPVRELATRYSLAPRTITMTLQRLLDEGVLESIPRVGIVVAKPMEPRVRAVYLAILPGPSADGVSGEVAELTTPAFEMEIARLGGRTARVTADVATNLIGLGGLEQVGGVYIPGRSTAAVRASFAELGVPMVSYTSAASLVSSLLTVEDTMPDLDVIEFDNVGGGRHAAELLIRRGSARVGFAGIHLGDDPATERYGWSIERARGWAEALTARSDAAPDELRPAGSARSYEDRVRSVAHRACSAVRHREVDALVCANDDVALGVIAQLRSRGVPPRDWPALVGFDSVATAGPYLLTSFRLPWEEVGKTAADLLWRRAAPEVPPDLRVHQVRMDLAQRLSTEQNWAEAIADLALFVSPQH